MSIYFENFQRHSVLNKASFRIKSLDVGVVNAVRRVIMSYLPTLAVGFDPYNKDLNDLTFHKNTTTLHNEILGHRISMIPLHLRVTDPAIYRFEINISNSTHEVITVTTDHIKCFVETFPEVYSELPESSTRTIFPIDKITGDPIIITKLKPREELFVTFKTRKGYGYQNACWSPVSLCSYTFVVDEQKAQAGLADKLNEIESEKKMAEEMPREAFAAKLKEIDERQENYKKVFDTLDRYRFFHTNQYGEPTLYDFQIEVENGSDPIDLVGLAFRWLEDKLDDLAPTIQKIGEDFYLLTFTDSEHTIGNLLQTLFFREYVRKSGEITYVGYNVPHPLEKVMIMKLKVVSGLQLDAFLETAFQMFKNYIESIRKDWELFTKDVSRNLEVHMELPPVQKPIRVRATAKEEPPKPRRTEADALPPKPKAVRKKAAVIEPPTEDAQEDAPPPKPKAVRKKAAVIEPPTEDAQEDALPPKPKAVRKKAAVIEPPTEDAQEDAPPPKPKAVRKKAAVIEPPTDAKEDAPPPKPKAVRKKAAVIEPSTDAEEDALPPKPKAVIEPPTDAKEDAPLNPEDVRRKELLSKLKELRARKSLKLA
jgi:DNA-directed RNA polymerase alpha subunit/DNA-directed RNA polymerase subunit L